MSPEQIYQLVTSIIDEDLLYLLAIHLHRLPFESRKDTQVIFSYVFRFRPPTASPNSEPIALAYVVDKRPQVLVELCRGYDHKESATPAGSVLREVLKSEAAAAVVLYDDGDEPGSSSQGVMSIDRDRLQSGNGVFWRFFDWIDKSSFEVAADAFTTFRVRATTSFYRGIFAAWPVVLTKIILGTHKQAQRANSQISCHKLRIVFRQIQPHPRPV